MASTDYDFALTRNEIIYSAYKKIGVIGRGDHLAPEFLDDGIKALNLIVKELQTEGHIYLWAEEWLKHSALLNIGTYSFPSSTPIIFVEQAYVREDGDDTPLEMISWPEYCGIQDKDDTGTPTHFASNIKENKFYLWPLPDAAYDIYYLGVRRLKDWDSASGSGDLPVRFQKALVYQLAADLGDDFGVNTDKFEAKAFTLLGRAKRSDKTSSTITRVQGAFSIK